MLQNPLVIQIITGIISLVLFAFGLYFVGKYEEANSDEEGKYKLLAIVVFIAAALGAIYFFCNIISTTPFTFGNVAIAYIKVLIFVIIAIETFLLYIGEIDDGYNQLLAILIPVIILLLVVPFSGLINQSIYENKVIEEQDLKYQDAEFPLLPIFNDEEIEGAINNVVSTNAYYNSIIEESGEDTTEQTAKKMYEICYIKNGQKLYKKVEAEDTAIIPLEKGKEPYLLIKTYTKYGIDYNQDPTEEYIFEESHKYELHVPMKEDSSQIN